MEALRNYLKEMPKLSDVLLEFLGEVIEKEGVDYNRVDDMRDAIAKSHAMAMDNLKERKIPYYALTYPQSQYKCEECRQDVRGAYYEVSNPITNARGTFRVKLMHEWLEHGRHHYVEPIINMSETKVGDEAHGVDCKKLSKILDGLPLPPEVAAELQAGIQANLQAAAGK